MCVALAGAHRLGGHSDPGGHGDLGGAGGGSCDYPGAVVAVGHVAGLGACAVSLAKGAHMKLLLHNNTEFNGSMRSDFVECCHIH